MSFQRHDEIVNEHSTASAAPEVKQADHSLRVLKILRPLTRALAWLLAGLSVFLLLAFLLFRYLLLPQLDSLRPGFERLLGEAIAMPVKVGRIEGEWQLWGPRFVLHNLSLQPSRSAPAIALARIELVPSWKSLLYLEPRLTSLQLDDLSLALRRDRGGRFFLNGIPFQQPQTAANDYRVFDWLLRQDHIQLRLRELSWRDEMLSLPPLSLQGLSLTLRDGWQGHRLQLQGKPDSRLLPGLSVDASWRGGEIADFAEWAGDVSVQTGSGELSLIKRYWPDAPFAGKGRASSFVQAGFAEGRIMSLHANWQVEDVALAVRQQNVPLPRLAGEVDYQSPAAGEHRFQAKHLTLATDKGYLLKDAAIEAGWHVARGGRLRADKVVLDTLWPWLQERVPQWQDFPLRDFAGELHDVVWQWQGPLLQPKNYRLSSQFSRVATVWRDGPALAGALRGNLLLGSDGGEVQWQGNDLQLRWPQQLRETLAVPAMDGRLQWSRQPEGVWRLQLQLLKVQTGDFTAQIHGDWHLADKVSGRLDISVPQVDVARVPAYLPEIIGKDTLDWLYAGLRGGVAREVKSVVEGDFASFPFAGGKSGRFEVTTAIDNGRLRFDPAWPDLENIQGRFVMRNDNIEISASKAATLGLDLAQVRVALDDLVTRPTVLDIQGKVAGKLAQMLAYTGKSPVDGWLDGFLATLAAEGAAKLDLGLKIPLDDPEASKVDGKLALAGNRLRFSDLPLPPLAEVNGNLAINERGVNTTGIHFTAMAGKGVLRATQHGEDIGFTVEGEADVSQVLQRYVPMLQPFAHGQLPYRANFTVGKVLSPVHISSSLQPVALSAPAPLTKAAGEFWPLELEIRPEAQHWLVNWQQAPRAAGQVKLDAGGNLRAVSVGAGVVAPLQDGVISIAISQPQLALMPWLQALQQASVANGEVTGQTFPLLLRLKTPLLTAAGYRLEDVDSTLRWAGGAEPFLLDWHSQAAAGQLRYVWQDGGQLSGKLSRLRLPLPEEESQPALGVNDVADMPVPALDVAVDNLSWRESALGALHVQARVQDNIWQFQRLSLGMPDSELLLSGVAARQRDAATRINVAVKTQNAGALLARFGMNDVLIGGQGELQGQLQWPGRFLDFQSAQLAGNLALSLERGRFAEVNPGAARLLGILSLQSIGRRIRLDFTDVFSSGFSFDTLKGDASIAQGVFRSNNVKMSGPGASVEMAGWVDLGKDTQDLRASIVPHLSESVSLLAGATLVNPVLGAVTLLTQKILQDPINRVFSFDYHISGSLSDPVVVKMGEKVEPAASAPQGVAP